MAGGWGWAGAGGGGEGGAGGTTSRPGGKLSTTPFSREVTKVSVPQCFRAGSGLTQILRLMYPFTGDKQTCTPLARAQTKHIPGAVPYLYLFVDRKRTCCAPRLKSQQTGVHLGNGGAIREGWEGVGVVVVIEQLSYQH